MLMAKTIYEFSAKDIYSKDLSMTHFAGKVRSPTMQAVSSGDRVSSRFHFSLRVF